jgi:glycosyltransferase involved in cell wall biosynthesis
MRIAFVTATYPPYEAGTGNVCMHHAIEMVKRGHDVTVITASQGDPTIMTIEDGIKIIRYKPLFTIGNAPFLPQLLCLRNYDVLHLHFPFYFGSEMIFLINKIKKIKYVLTYHNDVIRKGFVGWLLKYYNTIQNYLIMKSASRIFVLSDDFSNNSLNKTIFRNLKEKTDIIPNGVDSDIFFPSMEDDEYINLNIINNKKIILFISALDESHRLKGLNILLSAINQINHSIALLIVGDGNLRHYYENMAEELNVTNKVIFLGRVQNSKLPHIIRLADIFVLPSISTENFPLTVLEAMATGVPPIVSNLAGVRTLIIDGKDGLLFESENIQDLQLKIEFLLNNDDIRKVMGNNARSSTLDKYSWNTIGEKLEENYRRVLI